MLGEKSVETVTEMATENFTEAAWVKAQAVWQKLRPKVNQKEAAVEAISDVAKDPQDQDMQICLRVQLKKLLENDESLWKVILEIMEEDAEDGTSGTQIIQNVTGSKNQVIGQVSGGSVIYQNDG